MPISRSYGARQINLLTETESKLLFSVIIPLEYHRDQWERCWQGWQSQTLSRSDFEIILVVPPGFPHSEQLHEFANTARLEYSRHEHDIGLCVDGAKCARGEYLFFTEAHCWPEPDVLEVCLRAIGKHPRWVGFSCRSVRTCRNRLSEVEADMYEADFAFAMANHPWRQILDQCFVTRRAEYFICGGLDPQLGHFAEWALAARYAYEGYDLGYLPEARVHHYYEGAIGVLKAFTQDFVRGEIDYFNRGTEEPGRFLLEAPTEWDCRGDFDAGLARAVLRMSLSDALQRQRWEPRILRWLAPALFGDLIERARSAVAVAGTRLALAYAVMLATREGLARRFKDHVAALIHDERLRRVAAMAKLPATPSSRRDETVMSETGFYRQELYLDEAFRWSKTEAAIRLRADAGRQTLRIKCLPVRSLSDDIGLRFHFDGRPLDQGAVVVVGDAIELQLIMPSSGTALLGWICMPFPAKPDPRTLGLPVMGFELAQPY